ncbi:MAG: hypothetical protein HZC42_03630 [Candidatus Eisenbacteria bacterium]|nr:hypothetical protein [Candidatus Eisenbacteria bacterium]
MTDWRGRLARGALLAVAAGLLFTLGYDLYARRLLLNPSDAALATRFRAHRAGFDELLVLDRAHLRPADHAIAPREEPRFLAAAARRDDRRRTLARRLGLDGGGPRVADSLISFAASAWLPRHRFDDVKGYAFSPRPPGSLVEDLDAVAVRPRRRGEVLRWHRPLEGDWYLFREVGSRGMR